MTVYRLPQFATQSIDEENELMRVGWPNARINKNCLTHSCFVRRFFVDKKMRSSGAVRKTEFQTEFHLTTSATATPAPRPAPNPRQLRANKNGKHGISNGIIFFRVDPTCPMALRGRSWKHMLAFHGFLIVCFGNGPTKK